ncbi:MAG: pentapeptide repeat-containing protein [Planctomycetota bacterium]
MVTARDAETQNERLDEARARASSGEPMRGLELRGLRFTAGDLGPGSSFDFSRCDLRGAAFERMDLAGSSFAEADLSGASFNSVNLEHCDLGRCSGRGSVFTDVNLSYAQFSDSDLRGAIFFDANMADISFKGASLDGSEIDAIRLSLNGSTHVLGLKEALRTLADEDSYPYISGVSGDAFWLTYYLKTSDLGWGGFPNDALRRGLENFSFRCEFKDETEPDAAWDELRRALMEGGTVITPLHVSAATMLGCGFGGAEWVFVTGIDRGDVLVNCLLGDGLRFPERRFRAGWCQHHPLEESAADLPIIYTMCVVGARDRVPSRAETTRAGIEGAVEILTIESTEKVAFGFDAYRQLVSDLQSNRGPEDLGPDAARRFLPWLGLGMRHLHGSRWAVRDFLDVVLARGDFSGREHEALDEARDLYQGACDDLRGVLEILPWSFELPSPRDRKEAIARYHKHREDAADMLRAAAAKERDALERFRAIIDPS